MINILNKVFHYTKSSKKIVIQTETTGLYPKDGHKLVEIAAIEIDKNDNQTGVVFHVYINPEREVPEEVVEIHGLNNEFLQKYPTFEAYKDSFCHFIKGKEIIGHNIQFDLKFLNNEIGFELPNKITDTLEMARNIFPNQKNNLSALGKRLKVKIKKSPFNGALLNTLYICEIYKRMKNEKNKI